MGRQRYLPENPFAQPDRAAVFKSLEGCESFLNHRLAKYAERLPLDQTYHCGTIEYLMKNVLGCCLPCELFKQPTEFCRID